jgi:hypothetical protein
MNEATSLRITDSYTVITCGHCHLAFAVSASVEMDWRRKGEQFFCPHGHPLRYTTQTEADTLRKQLELKERELTFARNNAQAERAAREKTERQLTARKGINTRLRNRIKHGVCPCCHRTFQQLARHIQTQHPQFNKDDGE